MPSPSLHAVACIHARLCDSDRRCQGADRPPVATAARSVVTSDMRCLCAGSEVRQYIDALFFSGERGALTSGPFLMLLAELTDQWSCLRFERRDDGTVGVSVDEARWIRHSLPFEAVGYKGFWVRARPRPAHGVLVLVVGARGWHRTSIRLLLCRSSSS